MHDLAASVVGDVAAGKLCRSVLEAVAAAASE